VAEIEIEFAFLSHLVLLPHLGYDHCGIPICLLVRNYYFDQVSVSN